MREGDSARGSALLGGDRAAACNPQLYSPAPSCVILGSSLTSLSLCRPFCEMSRVLTPTSLDSCEDELNDVVCEPGLMNSGCSVSGSNGSRGCLWKASCVTPHSPFRTAAPQSTTEVSGRADTWAPTRGEGGGWPWTRILPPGCHRFSRSTPLPVLPGDERQQTRGPQILPARGRGQSGRKGV